MQSVRLNRFAHPSLYSLSHALLEGEAEGAVAAVAAVAGELLGADDSPGVGSLLAECDEMIDAQRVDIVIVSRAMIREILAEIEAVGTNGLSQLRDGQVVLQVELRIDTVLGQRSGNDGIQVITALAHHVPLALWRGVGSEAGVGGEAAQRLDAPQQKANKHDAAHLYDVFVGHATEATHVKAENQ